jgi:hypothetical protein
MDGPFLKFWGEFMLQAAEGQRKLEDLFNWMQSGYSPSVDLAALFSKCYGLTPGPGSADLDRWQKATADFSETLKTCAPLWGWVPLDRYDKLKEENERLKAKIEKQERLIKRLEALLADGGMEHMSMIARFQDLITDQNQAFDKLMQALTPAEEASDKIQK